jgi:hypothetical protein
VDVAELVGQQEQVAMLEDLDAPEVGRLLDRRDPRLDEAHAVVGGTVLRRRARAGLRVSHRRLP